MTIPSPFNGALPRWPGGHRSVRVLRRGRVLGRPVRGYAEQVRGIANLGCSHLQLDDTSVAYLDDPAQRAQLTDRGDDAGAPAPALYQADQRGPGRPAGFAVTTHMCRGKFRSSWAAEGSYDFVAEAPFSELDVDGGFLEFDDERSGGFAPSVSCRPARWWCSASSPPRRVTWSPRTPSSGASTKPPSTSRSSSFACNPSVASPPLWKVTC